MNVVIYARYSPGSKQTQQSIDGQLRECEKYCQNNGYTVIARYIDRALTGRVDSRPEFQRMIKDSAKKLFQYVIVYSLDRFSRDKYDNANYKYILKKNNKIKVLSATENISDDPSGILMETMLEGMAQYYSAELKKKVTRGMYESFMKGQFAGGGLVYGYDIVDKKYVVNKAESEVVKFIFSEYANGKTVKVIIEQLSAKGIRNKKGEKFVYNSVMNMLRNVKYIGSLTFGAETRENVIEPIIDKETFEKVAKRIMKNKLSPASIKAQEQYILTLKAFCGYCHSQLVAETGTARNGTVHRYYKCEKKKKRKEPCEKLQVNKSWLEMLVARVTYELLLTDGIIERIAKQIIKYNNELETNSDLKLYEKELEQIIKQLDRCVQAICDGVPADRVKDKMLELENRKAELQGLIDKEKFNQPIPLVESEVIYWFEQFTNGNIDDPDFRERIVDAFVNKVILFNDKVVITYNIKDKQEKLTVKEILAELKRDETKTAENKRFKLFQFGGRRGT